VVEARVQALQHRLRGQVELVEKDPVPGLERRQERPVVPRKGRDGSAALRRQVGAEQVADFRLKKIS
jgi:hypothetical protein